MTIDAKWVKMRIVKSSLVLSFSTLLIKCGFESVKLVVVYTAVKKIGKK